MLKKLEPDFTAKKVSVQKITIWIRLKNVLMELVTVDGISHIASAIGNLLYMDKATKNRSRVLFARNWVEIGQEDDLPDYKCCY